MICPNCQKEVDLTISRYFKNITSKFICPYCSIKFKLNRTWKYYLWLTIATLITVVGMSIINLIIADEKFIDLATIGWIIFMVFISWHFDRKIENNMETKISV